jgi:NAD(P)-dependent dehydrogenase (short-subunit alcohol dehydrogenase family)
MASRLAGKVCLITGTGGSIGRATALTFAREGAAVVGCDVGVEAAEQTAALVHGAGGLMVSLQPCLLDDPTECAKLVDLALREFGRLDVLFNLAGRAHFGELENVSDEDWDAARRDEVDLIFYLTRAAWPHLKASRGVVVNMASLNGQLSFKNIASLSHTTNKAAILGMTRQLAMEGSMHGIRQLDLAGPDRKRRDAGAARRRERLGTSDARQDALGTTRATRGGRERRPVPLLRR